MAEGGSDTAQDAALEPTLASAPGHASGEALDDTLAADTRGAAAAELPDAVPDRYTLGEEIGRGGLGAVVSAKDKNLGRLVAIKALHASGGSARRRFVREAMITARLEHPSIVPVHDAGRWPDGSPFYAMKLVRGRPLAAVIDGTASLAARLALVPTVLAVCDAVAYAHSERVVHRDLKPHNVLVGEFGETVVIDWGLAKELGGPSDEAGAPSAATATRSTETVAGSVLGTPAYMAPEQATGGEVDERADVYALGAMLYHVLVGKPPRDGGSVDEVLDRAVTGAVVPLTTREPGVPRDLAAIVGKAMARAPSDRYPSARELADDLRRFTTGQLVGAHRYTWSQRARRWLARHRAIAVTVAAAVAVTATIATISVRDVLRERDRADGERDVAVAAGQRADQQRAAADAARATAQAAANRAVLAQARGALERDPALALAWLATLSVDGPGWDAARVIAADALWRGAPERVLRGHRGTPRGLSVSGTTEALSWDDGAVWRWDLAAGTGRAFAIRRTHAAVLCGAGRIVGEGIRPDGTMSEYAIDAATGAIAWGAVPTGERERCGLVPAPAPEDCDLVDATPDGKTIACGAPAVTVRRAGGAARLLRKRAAHVVEIDDDGTWIAADDDGEVDVYDVASGALRWKVPARGVAQLAFSPDGGELLVIADDSVIFDLAHGGARPFGGDGLIAAAYLADGRIATIGADRTFRLWAPRPLPARQGDVAAAGFTPDGGALVIALADGTLARIAGDHVAARAKLPAAARGLAVRADGAVVATIAGGDVWSWRAGAEPARVGAHREAHLSGGPNDVDWLGDDVVSWNGETVRVWPGAGASFREIELPPLPPPPPLTDTPGEVIVMPTCGAPAGTTSSLVIPPRGRTLAIARETMSQCDQLTYLVDVDAGAAALLDGADGRRAAFSPDGGALLTSAPDGELRVWDVASRKARTIDAHLVHPLGAAVSADGAWLAATGEGAVALAHTTDAVARVLEVDEPELAGAWLDRTGATLVAGAASGAWIWDLASGERRHLGIGAPLAIHVGDDELDAVAEGRVWRIRDDLPRAPADLARRLAALGYTLPSAAP
jgi:WD40 repeat protein